MLKSLLGWLSNPRPLLAGLAACLPGIALAWDYTPTAIPSLAVLYGYLDAQNITLTRAADRYPALRPEIQQARAEFDRAYPNALPATLRLLQGVPLPAADRAALASRVADMNRGEIDFAVENEQQVRAFLQRVHAGVRGDMEPATLQMLLAAVYEDRPAAEQALPLARVYRASSTVLGKDLNVSLRIPRSWERDAAREQIQSDSTIFAFTSQGGTGLSTIDLLVRPLTQSARAPNDPTGGTPDPAARRSVVSDRLANDLRFLTGTTAKVLAQGNGTAGHRDTRWASFVTSSDSSTGRVLQYGRAWFFPMRDKGVTVMLLCRTGVLPEAAAEAERKRLDPLWEAVAASVSVAPAVPVPAGAPTSPGAVVAPAVAPVSAPASAPAASGVPSAATPAH